VIVIPAKAGIQNGYGRFSWIPAFAGMTNELRFGRSQAFTPAPSAGGAAGSSGHRARAGAARSSTSPRARRMAPAQAIIAALSVQSAGGGTAKRKP
jgi:hypothetical protein